MEQSQVKSNINSRNKIVSYENFVNQLFLKVVLVGLIDCIVFIRTMEVIYDRFVELEMLNVFKKRRTI